MADLAIVNAAVWTGNAQQPWAQGVAVAGDRIVTVGSDEDIQPLIGRQTRVIDAAGRLVLPGFNDAHVHFVDGGLSLTGLDLRSVKDEQELAAKLSQFAARLPRGTWVTGGHWDHEAWPCRKRPTKRLLDTAAPEHPVFLSRTDGHIAVANSLALKLAGITKDTPDPVGGLIERDPETGEPTGILVDNALSVVWAVIPEPTLEDLVNAARAAMRHAASLGVTSIHCLASVQHSRACQRLWRTGELTTRLYVVLQAELGEAVEHLRVGEHSGDSMLRTGALKVFADGSLGARSAFLFAPYEDDPSTSGLAMHSEEELCCLVEEADLAGLQVALHAIGDKAVHWALNAFERAIYRNSREEEAACRRHRIEHAQVVQPEDRRRFAQLDVIASIQPSHCIDDMRWIEGRLGSRCRCAYPFRSLLAAEATAALGTDWTVEPLDPMVGLYAAVSREFPCGGPPGGWYPEEKVTLEEALRANTHGSAYAEFQEHEKGSLEPGKLADMVLLSKNLFAIPVQQILNTKTEMTIVGGRVVYERGEG